LCEQIRGRQARRIEGEIAVLEEQHEQLAGKIAMLTAPKMIAMLTARAGELESRIEELKAQLVPMQERWDSLTDELRRLRERMAEAERIMAKGSNRAKAQALRDCIERIECTYDDSGRRSRLVGVTIVPRIGAEETFAVDRPRVLSTDGRVRPA
jgi:chromosome segregation ATPase